MTPPDEPAAEVAEQPAPHAAGADAAAAAASEPAPKSRLGWIAPVVAALLFGVSLLAVMPAPLGFLWKLRVGVTELGQLFAAVALIAAGLGWRGRARPLSVPLCLLAAVLFSTPLLRARSVAVDLPERVRSAFGDATPRALPGAPARETPFALGDLWGYDSPEVEVSTHRYAEAGGVALSLDLYRRADAPRPLPIVVMIHGGSWRGGTRAQLPAINRYLAARGYAVASVTHRLAPAHPYPAAIDDVLAAAGWLRAEADALGLDAGRLGFMGRSSGGHLALLAAYRLGRPAVRGAVAWYPPTDLIWSHQNPSDPLVFDSNGVLERFMGGPPDDEARRARYVEASPMAHVGEDTPPTLLLHGEGDELVFAEQSARLAAELERAGVPHLHVALPWATHGCDAILSGPSGQLGVYAIERFLAAVNAD